MVHFSFGYQQLLADSLWIRWVQDIEACGKERVDRDQLVSPPTEKASDAKTQADLTQMQAINSRRPACANGWSYQMLDVMTDLDPLFRLAYALGAPTLSILADDPIGAETIFEKGLKNFPNDWPLYYRAGYHAYYEIYKPDLAAERFNRAAELGAPLWLKSFASRLYTNSGRLELALKVLSDYRNELTDATARDKVSARIAELEQRLKMRK